MKMKRFDGAVIAERGGNLGGFRRKIRSQALPQAGHFEEVSAVVRPQIVRPDLDAVDAVFGIGKS